MNLIIRQARIIEPGNPLHDSVVDIEISAGKIRNIGTGIKNENNVNEIRIDDLHISQGWFDSSVSFGEPGFEERETIENGLTAAASGGFTAVAVQPNTFPVTDNQSQVKFIKSKSAAVDVYPVGALTKNSDGKDLAELYDMKTAGAIAFGDYNRNLANSNLMKIALQYVQDFEGLLIAFSEDAELKGSGVVNEGIVSTKLGLKGIPTLAESVQVARNISLLEYTGGKIHFPTISCAESVALIKDAKQRGVNVSCSVSVHHLVLTEEVLAGFDTRFKVSPPLRSEADRKALIKGVKEGTIDMITSDHNPIDIENKKMEFDHAKVGTIGLESAFGALMTVLPVELIVQKLTAGRQRFGIEMPSIKENSEANLTLFTTNDQWKFGPQDIRSKSKNSAFMEVGMRGRVKGIYNNGQLKSNI